MSTARRIGVRSLLLFSLCVAASSPAVAQTYEVFHSFVPPGGRPFGPVLAAASGAFYGTTTDAGAYGRGSVFVMTPDGSGGFTYRTLHSFVGAEGAVPFDPLIFGADGNLYGAALMGGATGVGTLYRLSLSGELTRLHDFADGGGEQPAGLLLASDGAFYGTTRAGGAHGGGTVFRLGADEVLSVVHDFDGAVEGAEPLSGLIQVGSSFYGTTYVGGSSNLGTVYRIDMATSVLTTLHEFDGTYGANPISALILGSDGNLYGTASEGGAGYGTVFRTDTSGAMSLLHNFADYSEGASPRAPVFQAGDGKFYGTTAYGGCCYQGDTLPAGTVFRVDTLGHFELLATFWVPPPPLPPPLTTGPAVTPGNTPVAGLIDGHDGFLYGTLLGPFGAVYRIPPTDPQNLTYPHVYGNAEGPFWPVAPMTEANGALYTTTSESANGLFGSVLRFDGPRMTILTDLVGWNGANPSIEVMLHASDGNLYGTTPNGGFGQGTAFRITPDDVFIPMHPFTGDQGYSPTSGFLEAAGQFWATASRGGDWTGGTIYRMDASGTVIVVHHFAGPDGYTALSGLTMGADGKFYGTTNLGGSSDYGTIYSVDDLGTFTSLYSFDNQTVGVYPIAGFVLASDGNLYGASSRGGAANAGFVYRFDGSTATSVHEFAGSDGTEPQGTLIQASDGKLYGTTYHGGSSDLGTIFRVDASGNFELLHEFQGNDGSHPQASLMQASDGTIYSTAGGGYANGGVAYRLWFGDATPVLTGTEPTSGRAGGGTVLAITGSHLTDVTTISIGGIAVTTPTFMDQSAVYTVSPALSPGTLNDVTVEVAGSHPRGGGLALPGAWFADFNDVPADDIFHSYIESIVRAGITAGCGGGNYCRNDAVRRDQMAVFLLKAEHGSAYVPPACAGIFTDVACPGPFTDWIEQIAAESVTAGCGGGNYCPSQPVTRAQMAVFLLKTKEGSSYVPPPAAGIFGDVPQANSFAPWIEELANRGITGGCQASPPLYCPSSPNTRGQMAVFLVKTFGLQLYGP